MQEDSFSQVDEFKDFFESVYSDELLDVNKKGGDYILIDFS